MYQQWIGIGNVGKNGAEQRYTPGGTPVSKFSLAINRTWMKDGEKQEKTTWVTVNCWNKLAEVVGAHVTQGMKVMVIGEVEDPKPWTDKEGNTRAGIEVTASVVKFLSSRQGEHGGEAPIESDLPF